MEQYLAEVSHLVVRKFREVFTGGSGVYVNYRAFLEAMKAINTQGATPAEVSRHGQRARQGLSTRGSRSGGGG